MIRKVDELGRIVIPKEWRDHSGIFGNEEVQMKYDEVNKEITIKKYSIVAECCFCGSTDSKELWTFKRGVICNDCVRDLE